MYSNEVTIETLTCQYL